LPFLFLLVIDWIMKTTTTGRNNVIQWILWTQLDDLDFADDLALLSLSYSQKQDETTRLETISAGIGLKMNMKNTKLVKINTTANTPIGEGPSEKEILCQPAKCGQQGRGGDCRQLRHS
jgi:hypothetical protein